MSAPELLHRALEQAKRAADRRRPFGWAAFGGFEGEVAGLPGLCAEDARVAARADALNAAAANIFAGRLEFLGRRWPAPLSDRWWEGDVWLIDPVSGQAWPGAKTFAFDVRFRQGGEGRGDVKFVWELNRLQVLPPLALHAVRAADDGVKARVFDILRGWMRSNPPFFGVNWISGVEAASRVASLLATLAFVPPQTDDDAAAVRGFLHAHVYWIARYPSRFSSANNHRIAELAALYLADLCAPGLPGRRKRRRIQAELEWEMRRQFHPDGVGAEQSLAYAAYSLEWFTLAARAGEASGRRFSEGFRDRARQAVDALAWLLDQSGHAPRIGDDDHSRVLALTPAPEPRYIASVLAMTARWLGEPEPPSALHDPALRDLIGAPTAPRPSNVRMRTFERGGLTVWREPDGQGLRLAAFDHGPLGHLSIAAHGHADALAVWLHWGEEAVLVGPGTFLYHAAGPERDVLRGTAAHNTLSVNGQDQSRIVGPFVWTAHARTRLIRTAKDAVEAEHDGYRRRFGLMHSRRVAFENHTFLIEDRLSGRPKARDLEWRLGFNLAPDIAVETDGAQARLQTPKGRRLVLECASPSVEPLGWAVTRPVYASAFGRLARTNRLELSGSVGAVPPLIRTRILFVPRADHQLKPT